MVSTVLRAQLVARRRSHKLQALNECGRAMAARSRGCPGARLPGRSPEMFPAGEGSSACRDLCMASGWARLLLQKLLGLHMASICCPAGKVGDDPRTDSEPRNVRAEIRFPGTTNPRFPE